MRALIKKELSLFFSGPSAYLIGMVFFAVNACVLWILPTPYNLLNSGFASLDGFFAWIPLVFLFLVPALCMRSFSEEKKTGTLEWLLTRPLSDAAVVGGKWLACYLFLLILLLPTFIYFITISHLASPVGNVDVGAFVGAFTGILLLGMVLVSIGVFMSACTSNQMIAFVLSVVVSATAYWGFEALSQLPFLGRFDLQIAYLGIEQHYRSLSRGVIDVRDMVYYASVGFLFFWGSVCLIKKRNGSSYISWVYVVFILVFIQVLSSLWAGRWDLTSDKRYTLLSYTKEYLKQHKEPILVKVYLSGDLPAGFKRLEKSTQELLDEFRSYNPSLRYQFVDIYKAEEGKSEAMVQDLMKKGLEPTQLEVKTKEGMVRRLIFPCAEVSFAGKTLSLTLLLPQMGREAQVTLNHSAENLELQFLHAIRVLLEPPTEKIAFLDGHGEYSFTQTMSIGKELSLFYSTQRQTLSDTSYQLLDYKALIIARPTQAFSESQKYLLDQYVMNGGKLIWLISPSTAQMDSLKVKEEDLALLYPLNWDEVWFRYGFRIDPNMILDLNACPSPVVTGYMGEQPVIEFIPNVYKPVLVPVDSLTGSNVEPLCGHFVASIDTLSSATKKQPLLITSSASRKVSLPQAISADLMRNNLRREDFNAGSQIIGWWIEGEFESAFKALRPENVSSKIGFKAKSDPTAMVVIGDGGLIINEVDHQRASVFPCGYDRYSGRMYGNKDFFMNLLHRLCGHQEWIPLKARQVAWRLLDQGMVNKDRNFWILLNLFLPLLYISTLGSVQFVRRRKWFKP